MNKIKTALFTLALTMLSSSANSKSLSAVSEKLCLQYSGLASNYASDKEQGLSLAFHLSVLEKVKPVGKVDKVEIRVSNNMESVVRYVYTMDLNKVDAGRLVYLKCLGGAYD